MYASDRCVNFDNSAIDKAFLTCRVFIVIRSVSFRLKPPAKSWMNFANALSRLNRTMTLKEFASLSKIGKSNPSMEDLDGHRGVADIELAMEQSVGDAVVVTFDFDVVIDIHAHLFPLCKRVRFSG